MALPQKLPEVLIKPPLMNLRFPWAIWSAASHSPLECVSCYAHELTVGNGE